MASLAAAFAAAVLGPINAAYAADGQKQVLALFSMRKDAELAVVADRNLPTLLQDDLSETVDYYSEYIDTARFSQPQYQSAYFDFLRLKYGRRRLDLVIAFGGTAVDFLTANRELFPNTPVVFYTLEPPRARMTNATGLVNEFHFDRSIDLALALQPDLKHVYVVSGSSDDDRRYEAQARRAFQRFGDRLEFTYCSGLVRQDVESRLRTLPTHSIVFVVFVTQDGTGKNFKWSDYLTWVASVANAPTYSWTDVAVEAGIVGGNRRDQLSETEAIASLSARLLAGTRPDDIPVSSLSLDTNQVDWRQLRRWSIPETRVPVGTVVLFREPTIWDRYKWPIVSATSLVVVQAAMIVGLIANRRKRRYAETALAHLSRQLMKAQEDDRAWIARELHDDVSQQIAAVSLQLEALARKAPAECAREARHVAGNVRQAGQTVQTLSHRLHSPRLELLGLGDSLAAFCRELHSQGIAAVQYRQEGAIDTLSSDAALALFRVAQEALHNAAKHAHAAHLRVWLRGQHDGVELVVIDDGRGFDVDAAMRGSGLGLVSMQERMTLVNGKIQFESRRNTGTTIRAAVSHRMSA